MAREEAAAALVWLREMRNRVRLDDPFTDAIKREWGGNGVSRQEPYRTNGAWRAAWAVLEELERIAEAEAEGNG